MSEKESLSSYLCDFAKARGVNGSVLGDGHSVPAFVLGGSTAALGVMPPASPGASSAHPSSLTTTTSSTTTKVLLGDESLLHLHLLPMLLLLCIFVDLVNGLRALFASPGNPVVLGRAEENDDKMINWPLNLDMACLYREFMALYTCNVNKILIKKELTTTGNESHQLKSSDWDEASRIRFLF